MHSCVTCTRWPCLGRGGWTGWSPDLPTPMILWFCGKKITICWGFDMHWIWIIWGEFWAMNSHYLFPIYIIVHGKMCQLERSQDYSLSPLIKVGYNGCGEIRLGVYKRILKALAKYILYDHRMVYSLNEMGRYVFPLPNAIFSFHYQVFTHIPNCQEIWENLWDI